jgi:ABC-type amino acid transport substrate-binding protein
MRFIVLDRRTFALRRLVSLVCVLVMAWAILPAVAFADTEETPIRVGYYENEVFEEGATDDAFKTGYAYEYYQKLSEYTGWRYTYVYGDFTDLYQMLVDGDIDLLAGLAYRDDRSEAIGYPDLAMGNESYYLVKHDDDANITDDPATLNGHTIGVLDSVVVSVLNEFLYENEVDATLVTYPTPADLFAAFDAHEVDILAAESDGARGRQHAEVIDVFGTSDYYLCTSKSHMTTATELFHNNLHVNIIY